MRRRTFLNLMGATAAECAYGAPGERRPNFVVALCDDLGYGDLGCYGHPVIKTPNLDRFAGEGIRFTDCYASAPVCSPSRAGLMTGRTPNRAGIYDWISPDNPMHLRRGEVTLARVLMDAGYATCHSGKWHLNGKFNSADQPQPGDHGFEHWFSTHNNAAPSHASPLNFVRNGKAVGKLEGYSSTVIVEEAMRWLDGLDGSRPFFLFMCFHSPHEPIATAEEFTGRYPMADPRNRALYYGNVTQMDHEFGRLMAHLDKRGRQEDSLVFFTSDNGPETLNRYPGAARSYGTPGPLRSMKLSLYEGGIRVPGIARWPGRAKAGQSSATPIANLDLLPTFCELAGVEAPGTRKLDGASFAPVLDGRAMRRQAPLHWHYFNTIDRPRAAMRDGDWKILGLAPADTPRRPGGGFRLEDMPNIKETKLVEFELYNLRTDPGEKVNLAAKEEGRLRRMRVELERIYEEVRREAPLWS